MRKEKLVIVGNGMVGIRLAENVLRADPNRYQITIVDGEPHPAYDRIALSLVLSGERALETVTTHPERWYEENHVQLLSGTWATRIDRERRELAVSGERELPPVLSYDKLVLALGSTPVKPPIGGLDLKGVVSFRTFDDVRFMLDAAQAPTKRRCVVIGGGLLGVEAASGLARRGMDVTLVHITKTLMERQLDPISGDLLQKSLKSRGIRFLMEEKVVELLPAAIDPDLPEPPEPQVAAVRFADGIEVPADLVVVAAGIRPRKDLAVAAGLDCREGIRVDSFMRTSDPDIFAVGECAEHEGKTYGLVQPLYEMAKACAAALTRQPAPYTASQTCARLKVTGIDVLSAGIHMTDGLPPDSFDEAILHDPRLGIYRKLVIQPDPASGAPRLAGMVLYGDASDADWYLSLLREGKDLGGFRNRLLLGRAACGENAQKDDLADLVSLPDAAEICGCNGVCKGTIVKAVREGGHATLEDVRIHTKASASCGSCSDKVQKLIAISTLPGSQPATSKPTLCKCTDLSPDEVRERIRGGKLASMLEAFRALNWKTADGCPACRQALNYYLLSELPGKYEDDPQSRFTNERIHANIQRDGTYSVVPRIWGGITSPAQLRVIADVADRYQVPTVKITGGQRIDLLGIKKENLPGVWRELTKAGMVSGHAYGKAVRTVKTCVGSEWCRFGVQDSTRMGVEIEKMTWGSWTPHKVKMAASGCPRNCAEATVKDFGVVAVESGWEIHVGGNCGMKVRVAELLCKVVTHEDVLEHCGAFLQLYRKEARYKDRTAHWVERVGIDYLKKRLVEDAEGRRSLYREFLDSQEHSQKDPWAELAEDANRRKEFTPLRSET